eukprot:gene7298-8077_t
MSLTIISQGFPERISPNIAVRPQTSPLYLVGVGRINKRVPGYFKAHAEEFCKVAVALSPSSVDRAKLWYLRQASTAASLTEYLLSRENIITPHSISNPLKVAVMMKFTTATTADYLVHLFKSAFRSCPKASTSIFMKMLVNALRGTLEPNDELAFYFFDNADVIVTKNGIVCAIINIPEINEAFLNVFLDPTESIVPELYDAVVENVHTIEYK